jgi:hypothetical protein
VLPLCVCVCCVLQPYLKYHNPRTFEDMDKPIPNFKKFGLKSGAPDGEGGGGGAMGKQGPGLVVRGGSDWRLYWWGKERGRRNGEGWIRGEGGEGRYVWLRWQDVG